MIGTSPLAREFWEQGKSETCPIYDMHGHMGPWAAIYFPRCQPEQMIGTMDECGVKMLVFSHHQALMAPDIGNRPSIEAVRRFPDPLPGVLRDQPQLPRAGRGGPGSLRAAPGCVRGLQIPVGLPPDPDQR